MIKVQECWLVPKNILNASNYNSNGSFCEALAHQFREIGTMFLSYTIGCCCDFLFWLLYFNTFTFLSHHVSRYHCVTTALNHFNSLNLICTSF